MRHRLHLRLKALEKWLPDETKPHKALLPEWLMEDLRQQGVRFDASGLPEKSSLQEKASERSAPAMPAPSPAPPRGFLWLEASREDCSVSKRRPRGLIRCDAAAKGIRMPSVRKRLETLERSQSERGGTSKDEIVRRVLERVSDAELDLLGSAARAREQGRELTPAESAAAEAYASAVARESAAVKSPSWQRR